MNHVDFKQPFPDVWLVWCGGGWAIVMENNVTASRSCSACGVDIESRFKAAA